MSGDQKMDNDVQNLIDMTGASLPLAGRIIKLLADSGANRLEIAVAMDLVNQFRNFLPAAHQLDYWNS